MNEMRRSERREVRSERSEERGERREERGERSEERGAEERGCRWKALEGVGSAAPNMFIPMML